MGFRKKTLKEMKNVMKYNSILIPNVLPFFSYNNIYEIVVAETKKKN